MGKLHSIVDADTLKKSIAKLPADGEDELRFRAIRGPRQKEKPGDEGVGLFIGPSMLKAFVKEKAAFTKSTVFDGEVRRSVHEPKDRLVLITKGQPAPLRALGKACLLQAKLKHKIVVLKPGEDEPKEVKEDDDDLQGVGGDQPRDPMGGESEEARNKRLEELRHHLAQAFPRGAAARLKAEVHKTFSGSGENFSPVLTALELVEGEGSPENLADLESAVRAYLKHAQKDYSDRQKKDPVNLRKMLAADGLLNAVVTARRLATPTRDGEEGDGGGQQDDMVLHEVPLEERRDPPGNEQPEREPPRDEPPQQQLQKEDDEAAQLYERERKQVEQALLRMRNLKGLADDLRPLNQLYEQAVQHATGGRFGEAVEVLRGIVAQQKLALKKLQPPEGKPLASHWMQRFAEVKERLRRLEPLADEALARQIAQRMQESDDAAGVRDIGRALSLLTAVEEMLDQATLPPVGRPDAAERFEKLRSMIESTLQVMKDKVPVERIGPLKTLYDKALQLGSEARFDEGIDQLERIKAMPKTLVESMMWERKVKISEYKQGKKLGSGGQGDTYALDHTGQDPQAPKLVLKLGEGVEKEAEMYRKVGDHPAFPKTLGMQQVGSRTGLVLESIDGGEVGKVTGSLRTRMDNGTLSPEEYWSAVKFTMQRSLEGLMHLHDLGYAHLDVKPQNMMFDDKTGEVKLIDLGLTAEDGTGEGGTPGFRGPETWKDKESTGGEKSDVFGIGAIVYSLGERTAQFMYGGRGFREKKHVEGYGESDDQALKLAKGEELSTQVDEKTGQRKKKYGKFGVETEYVKFVNWLLAPKPEDRPSLSEALQHPFLKDRALSDEEVKGIISSKDVPFGFKTFTKDWPQLRERLLQFPSIDDAALHQRAVERFAELVNAVLDQAGSMNQEYIEFEESLPTSEQHGEDKDALEEECDKLEKEQEDLRDINSPSEEVQKRLQEIEKLLEAKGEEIKELENKITEIDESSDKQKEEKLRALMQRLAEFAVGLRELAVERSNLTTDKLAKAFWNRVAKQCRVDGGALRSLIA